VTERGDCLSPSISVQNCSGFPGSTYVRYCSAYNGRVCVGHWCAHHLHRISGPEAFDFPLLNVRYLNHRCQILTYEPPPLSKIVGGSTTHAPRMYLDIEEGFSVDVLDLVDPRLQFSVSEDGRGATGRARVHGSRSSATTWGTRTSHDV